MPNLSALSRFLASSSCLADESFWGMLYTIGLCLGLISPSSWTGFVLSGLSSDASSSCFSGSVAGAGPSTAVSASFSFSTTEISLEMS